LIKNLKLIFELWKTEQKQAETPNIFALIPLNSIEINLFKANTLNKVWLNTMLFLSKTHNTNEVSLSKFLTKNPEIKSTVTLPTSDPFPTHKIPKTCQIIVSHNISWTPCKALKSYLKWPKNFKLHLKYDQNHSRDSIKYLLTQNLAEIGKFERQVKIKILDPQEKVDLGFVEILGREEGLDVSVDQSQQVLN
jgi:hypothetical protein